MEIPYAGRAIINDNITSLEIVIPVKRIWVVIIFFCFWLTGWLAGEVLAIWEVLSTAGGDSVNSFILIWLAGWTVGGFVVFKILLWNLMGKEILTFEQGQLTINRVGSLFFKPKVYDLNEVKNIRILQNLNNYPQWGRRNSFGPFDIGGTIAFDYGLKTIKFGAKLEEPEAKHILQLLRNKKFIKDSNDNPELPG